MLVGKIWLFVVGTVLLPTVVSSKHAPGIDSSRPEGQKLQQKLPYHSVGIPAYQVNRKKAELNGQSNRIERTGNWTNLLDNKQHPKTTTKTRVHLKSLPPQGISQDVVKKSGVPLSKRLFDHVLSQTIRQYAIKTKFIRGMAQGTLPPTQFAGYMVQDTAYLANAARLYGNVGTTMQGLKGHNDEYAQFFIQQATKYNKYYQDFLKDWQLKDTTCVEKGPAVQVYMAYQQSVVEKQPRFLPIAMLPCTMLWPWMANSLIGEVDEQRNPYYEAWFKQNMRGPEKRSSTETHVDRYFAPGDEGPAIKIFCEGMMNEVNFFREACGEELLTLNQVCNIHM